MGTEFSLSTEVPVCQSAGADGQSVGYRLPRYSIPSHQKGRADSEKSANRFSHAHSEVWTVRRPGCPESESERGPVHFHMLFLDGIYTKNKLGLIQFERTIAPNQ
jgi:hypothetical protein